MGDLVSGLADLERLEAATETELRRFYVAACTERFSDVRLFIRNTGNIELEGGRHFKSGISGMADVWGHWFCEPWPMPLEIELKNVRTKHTDEQKNWAAYCGAKRVPYILLRARKGEPPFLVVKRWVEETASWFVDLKKGYR